MIAAPRWTQSIRFRLSLVYALAVFISGSMLIGGLYMWQVNRLDEPELITGRIELRHPVSGQPVELLVLTDNPRQEALRVIEYNAYLRAADNLKQGSLVALGILFVVAFGTGWWVSGWALRPVHRMVNVARDITATDLSRRIALPAPEDELKNLADTFDAMLDRLQTAFEDQHRFVQDASHELRNPLAVARANLELALSDPNASADDIRRSAEVAMRSTERMTTLVDDLVSQARSGVPEFTRGEIDLVALGNEVVTEFEAGARQRGIALSLVAPMAPLLVKGDGQALRRALSNLLSNALKAAPADTTVTVSAARGDHYAILSVADQGPGLSDSDQQHAFKRFWRGATSGGGAGLGLSIVEQIVERHGGVVSVSSVVGIGSTFTIKLPMVDHGNADQGNAQRVDDRSRPRQQAGDTVEYPIENMVERGSP